MLYITEDLVCWNTWYKTAVWLKQFSVEIEMCQAFVRFYLWGKGPSDKFRGALFFVKKKRKKEK